MTRSVARRRRTAQDRKGIFYLAIAALGFLVIGGAAIAFKLSERRTDRLTGCPVDHYEHITAVLVDMTDALNPTQAAALRNTLLKIRDGTPKFGRLEIYTLAPVAKATLEPVFAACSPGSGKDVDSSLYGNPQLADQLWRKHFGDRMGEVITEIQRLPPQETSPILEGVKSVSVTAFGSDLAREAKGKKLVLISDLIEHGPEFSMYQGAPDIARFRESQTFAKTRPGLRGAEVELVVIERQTRNNVQNARWRHFWVGYFESVNSAVDRWVKIEEY